MTDRLIVRVANISRETDEIISLSLVDVAGRELPPYDCGAHIDVHLPSGLIRQYSLWPAPGDRSAYRIAVKREPNSRGGSAAVHDQLAVGDEIQISAPRNNFALVPDARKVILLAGGIGITPLLSMALHMQRTKVPFDLHYFTRAPEMTAFRELLSDADMASRISHYYGLDAEAVAEVLDDILDYRDGTHVYLCGPGPFMDTVCKAAEVRFPHDTIHLEFFSADVPVLEAGGDTFQVHLAKSGLTVTIPSDKSIADVLIEQGLDVELSCEQGICGTCLTTVLQGEPQHEDQYLSDQEHARNDVMTICVSRCKGKHLTLDL